MNALKRRLIDLSSSDLLTWLNRVGLTFVCLSLSIGCDQPSHSSPQPSLERRSPHSPSASQQVVESKADRTQSSPALDLLPSGVLTSEENLTLFAPDDPTLSLELGLIDRVTHTCRTLTQPQRCKIRYAVYNLTSELITQRLIEAARSGVHVQVLIEADQLTPERSWNRVKNRFIEAGLIVEDDDRHLTVTERERAHLIGVDASGLMHLKMRVFETPHWRRLLTGSLNPNMSAHLNDETLHLITDEEVIRQYKAAYDALLYQRPFSNEWRERAPINVLFTPADEKRAINQLFRWVAEEREQILLMVFALRDLSSEVDDRTLSELLIDQANAGVSVHVITDKKQSDRAMFQEDPNTLDDVMEDRLRAGGVSVYEALNNATPYTAMHHKVAILGRSRMRVISGAANWSRSALGSRERLARNVESLLFIDSFTLDQNFTGRRFLSQWLKTLGRYAHQSEAQDDELSAEELFSQLSAQPDWPMMPFSFHIKTHKHPERSLGVTGDLQELGWWGTLGSHPLIQDEQAPDMWRSHTQLSAPLGTPVNWKIIRLNARGELDGWETRGHRLNTVSEPLTPHQPVTFEGTW